MEKHVTVEDLTLCLKDFDKNAEVHVGFFGITSQDGWETPLLLEDFSVEQGGNKVLINFSLHG